MTIDFPYKCPLCEGVRYSISELRGASGGWTAMFNYDTAVFTVLTCANCRHATLINMFVGDFKEKYERKSP